MADTANPDPINSHTLIPQIIRSLYDSANVMLGNFGLSIIRLIVGIVGLIAVLLVWAMIASLRNRKSFTLQEEDEIAIVSESPTNLQRGVFRPTRYPEGTPETVA